MPADTAMLEESSARFVIELESQGTDFHTVFKNQSVSLTSSQDLLVNSIMSILEVRGFILREQVISYFSRKAKQYVAVAKHPIPADAIIPGDDIDKNARLTLKIWPPEHLPESLVMDLDCQPERHASIGAALRAPGATNGILAPTMRSSRDGSVGQRGNDLHSMSSCTSYGKEPVFENTIEQILGNIERSNLGDLKDQSQESYSDWRRFTKQLDDPIHGA